MDSNFQVKITADLSDLQARIKSVEGTLNKLQGVSTEASKKLQGGIDGASASVERLNNNANRGRLAAFAFGQVIRDAGFFANDFGLGLLAISNNIPILIDQLVLLTNVSKGLGVALSLAGSIITAAMTVVAYTMMYAKDATEEYNKELAKNTAASQTQITTLNSLLSIAKDESLSLGQRQDAVNRLNKEYDIFNGNLTVNGAKSQETSILVDRLTQSLLLNAKASALANQYTEIATKLLTIQSTPLAQQATLLDKVVVYWNALLDAINPFTGANNPIEDFTKGANVSLNKLGLKNFTADSKALKLQLGALSNGIKDVYTQLTALQIAPQKDPFKQSAKSLKTFGEITKAVELKKTRKEIDDFFTKPVETKNLMGLRAFPLELIYISEEISRILSEGLLSTISSSFMAIGEAIATGGNVANAAGAAFLSSIANVAQQLGELAIGVGIGIKSIKVALESLNPVVAIAAGVALLTLAGYARGRASAISGSGKGGGGGNNKMPTSGTFGGVRPFASGGIVSGPTNALIGEYPGARNNPEVVAPLDKLSGIIAGSIGGGDMGGQLTARISGNDLVILLDRASKNRKNYF
jgi:hypothetical protein